MKLIRLFVLCGALSSVVEVRAQQPCFSPTGRMPKMLATCEWQARWAALRAENHPWWQILVANANLSRYSDVGRWPALAYQITGEASYAVKAVADWKASWPEVTSGDNLREYYIEFVLLRELLYPHLERTRQLGEADAKLRSLAEQVLSGIRPHDSDQVVGSYCGLALTDAVLGTNYLSRTVPDAEGGGNLPVGGLTATAPDRSTLRNVLRWYAEVLAKGGVWTESSAYNYGTTTLLYQCTEFLRQALGTDHFPEVTTFRDAHMRQTMHALTPSLTDSFQFGDIQDPNIVRAVELDPLFGLFSGLPGDDTLRAAMRQLHRDVQEANNWTWRTGGDPLYARVAYFADPKAPTASWRDLAGTFYVAPGMGHVYARNAQAAFHAQFTGLSRGALDHYLGLPFGSIRLWSVDSGWLLTHPLGYALDPRFLNQTVIVNRGPAVEAAELRASGHRPSEVTYAAGLTVGLGPDVWEGYYDPPPNFRHEHGRSVVWLDDGDAGIVIVHDRFHVEHPLTLPKNDRYYASVRAEMQAALGVVDTIWHMPVLPIVSQNGRSLAWRVGERVVRITQTLPETPPIITMVDETTATLGGYLQAGQKKIAAHMVQANAQPWQTVLTVITAGKNDAPEIVVASLVAGDMEGVRIQRPNQPDAVVLFSRKPGPKISTTVVNDRAVYDPRKADTVWQARLVTSPPTLTLPNATAIVYLGDLDRSVTAVVVNAQSRLVEWVGDLAVATLTTTKPTEPATPETFSCELVRPSVDRVELRCVAQP